MMPDTPEDPDTPHGKFKFGLLQAVLVAVTGVAIAFAAAVANNGL